MPIVPPVYKMQTFLFELISTSIDFTAQVIFRLKIQGLNLLIVQ